MPSSKLEKIIGVAIRSSDSERIITMNAPNLHHNLLHSIPNVDKEHFQQGFITSKNRFVSREDALPTAAKARQILRKSPPENLLFSEDLW